MTIVGNYLGENARYISDASAAVIEGLTDEQFELIADLAEELTMDRSPGVGCEVVRTRDTLADFEAARDQWNERGRREEISSTAVKYERVQIRKGEQRVNIIVADLGDYRIALKA